MPIKSQITCALTINGRNVFVVGDTKGNLYVFEADKETTQD